MQDVAPVSVVPRKRDAPVSVVPRKRRGVELALIIFALGLALGAYALVFGTLFAYWWRVERGIRMLEPGPEDHPARTRP